MKTPKSHAGDRNSSPGRDRPKSLKQVVTAPLPTLGNRCECHGSSEITMKTDAQCHSICGTFKKVRQSSNLKKFLFDNAFQNSYKRSKINRTSLIFIRFKWFTREQ